MYDRQIRLYGVDAQNQLKNSRVLVCGLHGIHVEVVKNLILTGVNVTILDNGVVSMDDLNHNYFLRETDIGKMVCSVKLYYYVLLLICMSF